MQTVARRRCTKTFRPRNIYTKKFNETGDEPFTVIRNRYTKPLDETFERKHYTKS